MENVLTLITAPARADLDDSTVRRVREALKALGGQVGSPDWLDPGIACDLPFEDISPDTADAAARKALADAGVAADVVAQAAADRRKMLLVADMDSTIVTGETLDELADFAGIKDQIAAITARAMNGELDFKAALRERVAMLKGLPVESLEKCFDRVEYTPGAWELVRTMAANGAYCVLVSGGFKFFTRRVAAHCGFHEDRSNEFILDGDVLAGAVEEPILDRDAKLDSLIALAAERHLPLARTVAVGDGANDLPMIRAAGLGVAFHAKPVVAAEARVRIDHGDLTALLYAQGYRRADFVV
ncbi:phosphoserine phosphatase SerB [Caenispirillum bisanense]|uniref:phosphoserine phosphatase SerB n=1 Tax=Caenispirillum bisanense TaxID=414052 RepID=UPI0031D02E88